jgi:hypothetical protein
MQPETDRYLAQLDEQSKALDSREAEAKARVAQGNADLRAVAEDRAKLMVARQHYETFLAASKPQPQAKMDFGPNLPGEQPAGATFVLHASYEIPLPMRMGAKRRRVLDAVATAGQGQTTREIAEKSGVQIDVARNITAAETKLGIFVRQGDKLYMTPAGLDYLNRVNEKFGPAQKETPPATAASGVFQ